MRKPFILGIAGVVASLVVSSTAITSRGRASEIAWPADLTAFTAMEPIDAHAHVFKADAAFYSFLRRLHVHLVDIVVAAREDAHFPDLETKIAAAETVVNGSKGQAVLCTTFDPFKFSDPNFAQHAIQQLNRDFDRGAVAVKIWKNVGMELKDSSGRFVMPDDPRFKPIYDDITARGKTLIAHLAEPDSCWQPPNPQSPDYSYYNGHPEWFMYRQPDHPRKATILKARDHMLEENPQLRVVGAHLGSMETNLDEIGEHFERFPNFAVDTAARVVYLTMQPRDKARQFLIKYQDRILYGTDLELYDQLNVEAAWENQYAIDWAYFSSDKTIEYHGRAVQGLALPTPVLRKLYHDNAVRWIHGVVPHG